MDDNGLILLMFIANRERTSPVRTVVIVPRLLGT